MTEVAHKISTAAVAAAPELTPVGRALIARIGGTPLLPLPSPRPSVRIAAKAEWFNPSGSVKDRAAWAIVRDGLRTGRLPGRRLLDSSSGNTAIAYAMLGAALGFEVTMCVPESASIARLQALRAYGIRLLLTDALEGSDGAILRARALADQRPDRFWYADQYRNPANWRAHYETTAVEIWRDTLGQITHFVAGIGTSGTLVGTGRRLHELSRRVRVIGVQPAGPLHGLEGLKHMESSIQPGIYDASVADEQMRVTTEEAEEAAARLAREAGLFVGPSAGAAFAAATRLASRLENGHVVTVLPDAGSRYLGEAVRRGG